MTYEIDYDPTVFVRSSIEAVVHTLFEAVLLVVLVVVVFLQTWRASVIPLVAVPVAIIGTMAALLAAGFSINSLTLVRPGARHRHRRGRCHRGGGEHRAQDRGRTESARRPRTRRWSEVTRPIISIMLVLCAVFMPVAFVSGLTGQFYRQFGITIAASTIISTFNSLTLSPALAALLLKPQERAAGLRFSAASTACWADFSAGFNRVFERASGALRPRRVAAHRAYAASCWWSSWCCWSAPGAFSASCPAASFRRRTSSIWSAIVQLPDAASLDRTESVVRQVSEIALQDARVSTTRSASPACRCRAS